MTPQERSLVTGLFDRLAEVDDGERDPEAERAISDGLRRAPHAVYALVQTALLQDEALKRADARIRALEAQVRKEPQQARSRSFLGGMRETPTERRGSEPPARSVDAPAIAPTDDHRGSASPMPAGAGSSNPGGSFLGTAAAAAAGAVGGSLMLNSIRGMMGPRQGAGGFGPTMASPAKASESGSPRAAAAPAGDSSAAHEAGHDTLTKDDEARASHGEDQVEDDGQEDADYQDDGDDQRHSDYEEHGEYEDPVDYDEDSEPLDDGDFDDGSGDFDGGGDFGGDDEA